MELVRVRSPLSLHGDLIGYRLGEAECGECGGKRFLLITSRGIFSVCERCGFVEWEWMVGDSPEYLDYLSERYGVSKRDIIMALERWGI